MLAIYGPGAMGEAYLQALAALGHPPGDILLVGRRREPLVTLSGRFGVATALIGEEPAITDAIVAVAPDALPEVVRHAASRGARRILVEKPGAMSSADLRALAKDLAAMGVRAHVAYNRRFFPSVVAAREIIAADGGALACFFEITEIEDRIMGAIAEAPWIERHLPRWGLVNPTHVIDLAGHLAGSPVELHPARAGSLPWHSAGATFTGHGVSDSGAALAYLGTWSSAGRWRVEVTTARRRLILAPLETLQQQLKGSFAVTPVELAAEPEGVKPGFTGMVRSFLDGGANLPDLDEGADLLALSERIFGYA